MDAYIIIVIIFSILTMLLLMVLYFVNRLYIYKNRIDHAYEVVDELMDDRLGYVGRFSSFIENELDTENNLVKRLNKLVDEYDSKNKDIKFVKKTGKYLDELKVLYKVYPKLKDKYLYQTLSKGIDINQERLEYAMDTYDKEVKRYNDYVSNKYISMLKQLLKFPDYDYYKRK